MKKQKNIKRKNKSKTISNAQAPTLRSKHDNLARRQLLFWLNTGIMAFTIFANWREIIDQAAWIRYLTSRWAEIVVAFWRLVLNPFGIVPTSNMALFSTFYLFAAITGLSAIPLEASDKQTAAKKASASHRHALLEPAYQKRILGSLCVGVASLFIWIWLMEHFALRGSTAQQLIAQKWTFWVYPAASLPIMFLLLKEDGPRAIARILAMALAVAAIYLAMAWPFAIQASRPGGRALYEFRLLYEALMTWLPYKIAIYFALVEHKYVFLRLALVLAILTILFALNQLALLSISTTAPS